MATTHLSSAAPTGRVRVLLATLAVVLGALAVAFAAKGRVPTAEATSIEVADLPARLADTGLYEDLAAGRIAAGVRPFTPQYPLWTDGARKERWISLPPGASIDATDPDAWVFPVGTKLWKEFAFERPIETRYLERLADGTWRFATYLWSADGSEASLAPEAGVPRAHESRRGVPYDVPGRSACLVCHGGRATPVLGFSALQLSPDRDPLAPHAEVATADDENLSTLSRDGRLRGLPADLLERAPRIEAPTARGRAALGYLHANCGTCHTDGSRIAGLDLRLDARLATGRGVPEALSTTRSTVCSSVARRRAIPCFRCPRSARTSSTPRVSPSSRRGSARTSRPRPRQSPFPRSRPPWRPSDEPLDRPSPPPRPVSYTHLRAHET